MTTTNRTSVLCSADYHESCHGMAMDLESTHWTTCACACHDKWVDAPQVVDQNAEGRE